MLHYWGLWGNQRADPKGGPNVWATQLVAKGTGRCGEWVYLFRDCLKAQGVKKEIEEVEIKFETSIEEFLPKLVDSALYIKEWADSVDKDGYSNILGAGGIKHIRAIMWFGASVNQINVKSHVYNIIPNKWELIQEKR